jgi:hypothetical protein
MTFRTACGNSGKHPPHANCVGIPLPPIGDDELAAANPSIAAGRVDADAVRRTLADEVRAGLHDEPHP